MDRTRPVYGHHKSPSTAAAPPSSQGGFSAINHRRSGSAAAGISNARRLQNTKTPAQRLAQASQKSFSDGNNF
nr:coiled-coil domain-containing protein SCD2-like isoform X1 [Ipomoea batatas]GME14648.1 coiled-coil domain-containing protein SCD2-like isoform X1 [Ipomoea batatas]